MAGRRRAYSTLPALWVVFLHLITQTWSRLRFPRIAKERSGRSFFPSPIAQALNAELATADDVRRTLLPS